MYLCGSKTLPTINYDEMKGVIEITGRSISVEVENYFDEFLPYLIDCLQKKPMNIEVTINLEYFNTKSAHLLLTMFNVFKKYVDNNGFVTVIKWYHEKEDEDILDASKDYKEMTGLNFEFVAV